MMWRFLAISTILLVIVTLPHNASAEEAKDKEFKEEVGALLFFKNPVSFLKLVGGNVAKKLGKIKIIEGIESLKIGKNLEWEAFFPKDFKLLGTENMYVVSDPNTGEVSYMTNEELERAQFPILVPGTLPFKDRSVQEYMSSHLPPPQNQLGRNTYSDIYENHIQETKLAPILIAEKDVMQILYEEDNYHDLMKRSPENHQMIQNIQGYRSIDAIENSKMPQSYQGINDFVATQAEPQQYQGYNDFVATQHYQTAEASPYQGYNEFVAMQTEIPLMHQSYRDGENKDSKPSNLPTPHNPPQPPNKPKRESEFMSAQGMNDFVASPIQEYQSYRAMEEQKNSKKPEGKSDKAFKEFVAAPGSQNLDIDAATKMTQGYRTMAEPQLPSKDASKNDKEFVATFGKKHKGGGGTHHHSVNNYYQYDIHPPMKAYGGYGGGGYGGGGYGGGGYGGGGYGGGGYGGGYGGHGGYGHGGHGGGYGGGYGGRYYRSTFDDEDLLTKRQQEEERSAFSTDAILLNNYHDLDVSSSETDNVAVNNPWKKWQFPLLQPLLQLTRALRQCPCEQGSPPLINEPQYVYYPQMPQMNNFDHYPYHQYPAVIRFARHHPMNQPQPHHVPFTGAAKTGAKNRTTDNTVDPSFVSYPVPSILRTPYLGAFGSEPTREYKHSHNHANYFDPYANVGYQGHHYHPRHHRQATYDDFYTQNYDNALINNKIDQENGNSANKGDPLGLKRLFDLTKVDPIFPSIDKIPKMETTWKFPSLWQGQEQPIFSPSHINPRRSRVEVVPPNMNNPRNEQPKLSKPDKQTTHDSNIRTSVANNEELLKKERTESMATDI